MKTKLKKGSIDLFVVAPGVWGLKDVFVNMYIIKNSPSESGWWLVDTGIRWSGSKIRGMAEILFGAGSRPEGIILTHGHFDHTGSVKKLAMDWNVPVYAHHLEIPYLTGLSSYPPADPTAGGGFMSDFSFLYPKGPINLKDRVMPLPPGGKIPGLSEWSYIHTPGHAAGHISLFRESDKVLISGDAVVTTKAESLMSTIFQLRKISGPPKYLTSDWHSAASSVQQIAALEPEILASGHGRPMRGAGMRKSLHNLVHDFQNKSVPGKGRYSHQPALMDDSGVVHIPPKNINGSTAPTLKILGITAAVLITVLLFSSSKKKHRRKLHNVQPVIDDYSNSKGKHVEMPVKKHTIEPVTDGINKLKYNLEKKSKQAIDKVSVEANKIKEPALEILENLKFKIKKQLK